MYSRFPSRQQAKSIALLLVLCIGGVSSSNAQEEEIAYEIGAVPILPQVFKDLQKVAPIPGSAEDESVVSLRKRFPTPRSQGKLGSCSAFAAGFAIKTYLERVRNGWPDNDDSDKRVFSPAFIYNQYALQQPNELPPKKGIFIQSALGTLEGLGCCTWETMPYDGINAFANDDPAIWQEAAQYRRDKWDPIDIKDISIVRQYLLAGRPIIFGAYVDTARKGEWDVDESGVTTRLHKIGTTYHAMVLVGYDDNKGKNGAFEIMNSWGPKWNDNGFAWVSYSFWKNFVREGYVVWDTREDVRKLLPKGVKPEEIRWLPPGPEGTTNGNWGYPKEVDLKKLETTPGKKFPEIIKEINAADPP